MLAKLHFSCQTICYLRYSKILAQVLPRIPSKKPIIISSKICRIILEVNTVIFTWWFVEMYRDIVSNPFLAHYNWQCATWCFGKNSLQKPIIISSKMETSNKKSIIHWMVWIEPLSGSVPLTMSYLMRGSQQSKNSLEVETMSWSRNWPHCISMCVFLLHHTYSRILWFL